MKTWTHEAIAAIGSGLVVLDHSGKILFANPRAATILNKPLSHLQGVVVGEVLVPLEELRQHAQEKGRQQLELVLHDGTRVHVGFSVSSFVPAGYASDQQHYVCLFQDISSVVRLRDERDRLLQLAAVGSIMPSLLNELRNPLAAITATVELLVEELPEGSAQDDLRRVLTEVQRITLINHRLCGLEYVALPLRCLQHAAIGQVIEDVVRMLRPVAARAGVQLTCQTEGLVPLPLEPAVIRAIVINLISNAIEACSAGDRIAIEARCYDQRLFELSVEDDGAGMEAEALERCTELFFSTKRRSSGIGLTLCHQAAEAAEGTLSVASSLGRGTKVTFAIPLNSSAKVEASARGRDGEPRRGLEGANKR